VEYDHCIRFDLNGSCPVCDGAIEHESLVKFRVRMNNFINSMMNNCIMQCKVDVAILQDEKTK